MVDDLKLARTLDKRRSSLNWTGSKKRIRVSDSIEVENLGKEPRTLSLTDHIPVSEDRDIRVFGVELEPRQKPDDKGLVTWKLMLEPGRKEMLRLGYTIEYPKDVRERMQTRQREADSLPQGGSLSAAESEDDLYEQIMSLEAQF